MKIITIICNLVLFAFTLLVVISDGPGSGIFYILLTSLLLLTPIVSTAAISKNPGKPALQVSVENTSTAGKTGNICKMATMADTAVIVLNLLLLGLVICALIKQYPHPAEPCFYTYLGFAIGTPVLNLLFFTGILARKYCLRNLKM